MEGDNTCTRAQKDVEFVSFVMHSITLLNEISLGSYSFKCEGCVVRFSDKTEGSPLLKTNIVSGPPKARLELKWSYLHESSRSDRFV